MGVEGSDVELGLRDSLCICPVFFLTARAHTSNKLNQQKQKIKKKSVEIWISNSSNSVKDPTCLMMMNTGCSCKELCPGESWTRSKCSNSSKPSVNDAAVSSLSRRS